MSWVDGYRERVEASDTLKDKPNHYDLLVAGLFGEAGSVAAEMKKMAREGPAYPAYRKRLIEEIGDFLWYLVRLATVNGVHLEPVDVPSDALKQKQDSMVVSALRLGDSVAPFLSEGPESAAVPEALKGAWIVLLRLANEAGIDLEQAAQANLAKINSRWPIEKVPHELFDRYDPIEDQLPRSLSIEFREHDGTVGLRYGMVGIGDRITDNIVRSDAYRYHDVFHIAYAAFLGWSPVLRSLLRCKRKSRPEVDRDEDGARAQILEEAISATVFSRAKEMDYFAGASSIDYDLLKRIQEFASGYEVDQVPLWQWEEAILEGFRVFRLLRDASGGVVSWDLDRRAISHTR